MKIVVITNKSECDITSRSRQLNGAVSCIDIERFEAIYPNAIDLEYKRSFEALYGREPLVGEYGCYLSHRSVWASYMKQNAVLVLEDDARCEQSACLEKIIDWCGNNQLPLIVKLGVSKLEKSKQWLFFLLKPGLPFRILDGRILSRQIFLNTDGTVGYVINRSAMNLLNDSSAMCKGMLADDWSKIRGLGVKVLSIYPLAVYEDVDSDSSIDLKRIRSRCLDLNANIILKLLIFFPLTAPCLLVAMFCQCSKKFASWIKIGFTR